MKRVRRIRQAEMPQRIRNQQVAEFVINIRHRRGMLGEKRQPEDDRQRGQQQNAPAGPLCQPLCIRLKEGPPCQRECQQERRQRQFEQVAGPHAERVIECQKLTP
jgi:hypothetical protein